MAAKTEMRLDMHMGTSTPKTATTEVRVRSSVPQLGILGRLTVNVQVHTRVIVCPPQMRTVQNLQVGIGTAMERKRREAIRMGIATAATKQKKRDGLRARWRSGRQNSSPSSKSSGKPPRPRRLLTLKRAR